MNTVAIFILTLIVIYIYFHFNKRIESLEKEHNIDHKCYDTLKEFWNRIKDRE